jgi:hypothetical protein
LGELAGHFKFGLVGTHGSIGQAVVGRHPGNSGDCCSRPTVRTDSWTARPGTETTWPCQPCQGCENRLAASVLARGRMGHWPVTRRAANHE